jgi:two-component system response regulator AtoC
VLQEGVIDRVGGNLPIAVDIRVVAATNRDPRQAVQEGVLREDLFYRLNVVGLTLPPLRERTGDVPLLADYFLRKFGKQLGCGCAGLSDEALRALAAYGWSGNVRELENVMERAAVLSRGEWVELAHLPLEIVQPEPAQPLPVSGAVEECLDLERRVADLERGLLAKALEESDDNKAKAARLLKISERTLWYKLKKYGFTQEKAAGG